MPPGRRTWGSRREPGSKKNVKKDLSEEKGARERRSSDATRKGGERLKSGSTTERTRGRLGGEANSGREEYSEMCAEG